MVFNEAISAIRLAALYTLSPYFPTGFLGVLMRHELIVIFAQGGVLGNNNPKISMGSYQIYLRRVDYIKKLVPIYNDKEIKFPRYLLSCVFIWCAVEKRTGSGSATPLLLTRYQHALLLLINDGMLFLILLDPSAHRFVQSRSVSCIQLAC